MRKRPKVIRIHSENNLFQYADALRRNRVKRGRYRAFFVEGVASITRAVDHGWPIQYLLYTDQARLSDWARGIIDLAAAEAHLQMPLDLLASLSEKPEPSELLAIVRMPDDDLARILLQSDLLVIVLDRPSNHGNLGTIIRSCDALGVHGVVMTGHAVDLYDPRTIRASVGSLFSLPVVRIKSPRHLASWFERLRADCASTQVIGTSAKAERDVIETDLTRPTVLVIGNETVGLSRRLRELCDHMVRIPMSGSATSLNVACATSILLYEANRQRRRKIHKTDLL